MALEPAVGTLDGVILGGALIGLALAVLRVLTGRVMSASAMVGSLLGGREGPAAPSIAFIAGLFVAPTLFTAANTATPGPIEPAWALLVVGGLLVGFGARLGGNGMVGAVWSVFRRSGWAAAAMLAGVSASLLLHRLLLGGGAA